MKLNSEKKIRSIVWHEYAASRDAEFGDVKQWHRANPGLRLGIKSLEYMKRASKRALASSASAPSFAAYDLNLPQSPLREMIVSVGDYQKCLVPYNKIPSRKGVVCVGIDLGGSSSMTAAVLYWVEVGRLECVGAFGNKVSLKNRGEADGVGDLYNRMCAEGALKLYDGHAPSVSQFVKDLSVDLEGQKIVAIGCDRYRKSEFLDALEGARLSHWQHKLQFRGQGASMNFTADGSADVRAFQSAVVEKKLKLGRSLLLEHAIANSSISRDAAGNPKINRASNKGRIDALQAGVIAVGLGKRWSERKPKTKVRLHVV